MQIPYSQGGYGIELAGFDPIKIKSINAETQVSRNNLLSSPHYMQSGYGGGGGGATLPPWLPPPSHGHLPFPMVTSPLVWYLSSIVLPFSLLPLRTHHLPSSLGQQLDRSSWLSTEDTSWTLPWQRLSF